MAADPFLPAGYLQYVARVTARGETPNSNYAAFATRFKLASQLHRIEILSVSEQHLRIYEHALRISLAYSAFEQLTKSSKSIHWSIKSRSIAQKFRGTRLALFKSYLLEASNKNLGAKLTLIDSHEENEEILPIIEAIRNTFFHGGFNPSRANLTTKTATEFLKDVDQTFFAVLNEFSLMMSKRLLSAY